MSPETLELERILLKQKVIWPHYKKIRLEMLRLIGEIRALEVVEN